MTSSTLLPGVRPHGSGYQVRIVICGRRITEAGFRTADAANARALELRAMRAAGVAPATRSKEQLVLREAAESLLVRKRTAISRKTKRRLRDSGIEWWDRATRPWREGRYALVPLSLLRRDLIEDDMLDRAAKHPKTARDELNGLKAILRYAGARGASFDPALLTIEPIPAVKRRRRALSVEQLELLASVAPEYAQRMLLFLGTTGLRIGESFSLTDDRVDLAEAVIFIPEHLCKEGVDKWVDLMHEEVTLLREQLVARATSTPLVFPTKTGLSWRHFQFLRLVWYKARSRAAAAWRAQGGFALEWETPFDDLTPHDLRATAATLMRDAGFTRDQAAARLGHGDTTMLDRIYDVGDRRARVRRGIERCAPLGLRAEAKKQAPPPSSRPMAAPDRWE